MAGQLRPVEERDAKGATIRINPTIICKQDREIRHVVGRTDFRMEPNPDWHGVGLVTAQVQDGDLRFFQGSPESVASRGAAKAMTVQEAEKAMPKFIAMLKANPLKVREQRQTVYELKFATIDGVEVSKLDELPNDGQTVVVAPVAPDLTPRQRTGAPRPPEARV